MLNRSVPAAGLGLPARWTALPRQAEARATIETAIDGLIDLLDRLDPDPDLEPSLGGGPDTNPVDVEGDDTDLEETGDAEPWLGATVDQGESQRFWGYGDPSDCEETGLAEDLPGGGRCLRSWSETAALRAVEAEALMLAARIRRRCSLQPTPRFSPPPARTCE